MMAATFRTGMASVIVSARYAAGLWGLRPPGASRCCARASLRTPSRPHPRDVLSALGTPFRPIAFGTRNVRAAEGPSYGGWGREGVRSEARAQQRLAPGGRSPHNPEYALARNLYRET